jgi:hypothetical protein
MIDGFKEDSINRYLILRNQFKTYMRKSAIWKRNSQGNKIMTKKQVETL